MSRRVVADGVPSAMPSDRPKIVVLDAHTANPGDLSWDGLRQLGDVETHPRSTDAEAIDRAAGAAALLTNKVPIGKPLLERASGLRYVGVLATGYNVVDLDACRAAGVTVTNVPGYSTASTAQHALALLLELTNRVGRASVETTDRWPASPDFCFYDQPLIELDGLTCGVVGFGAIGQAFARRASAFGMTILTHTANPDRHRDAAAAVGATFVGLDELLRRSDAISLHCRLTPATENLIGPATLAKVKRGAFVINTGRGQLLDETAVAAALADGTLGGVAVDVLRREPPPADDPLLSAHNCVVTPHVAWATAASRQRLIDAAAGNLAAFLDGEPRNVVS